ncbi:MAG: hypothetical protein QOH14_3275 [Pseudonocardiales bacterium]|nr:hypothetical protein [Pseudonocardiales bacterium]
MAATRRSSGAGSSRDLRQQVTAFYGLFVLSAMMFGIANRDEILHLAISAVPSLGPFQVVRADYVGDDGAGVSWPIGRADREGPAPAGQLPIDGYVWGWAFELRDLGRVFGHLVAAAEREPTEHEHFLLTTLVQQTSAALSNATMYHEATDSAERFRALNDERTAVNGRLQVTIADLERQTRTHELLGHASASGGIAGLVEALYEVTGLGAAAEDQFGNLRAWAGPDGTASPRKPSIGRLAEIRRRIAAANGRPIRAGGRLVVWAKPGPDVLGSVSLLDPHHRAGGYEVFALEHASTLLAMELAHQRGVAELELRLRRELLDELLEGRDSASAYARAAAVGHDLRGPHHVISLRWRRGGERATSEATERALTRLGSSWLLTRRNGRCVVIIRDPQDAGQLFDAIADQLGQEGSLGVGTTYDSPAQLPESYDESVRALTIREASRSPDGVTSFSDLGIYRILGTPETNDDVAAFVEQWLGPLLAYDTRRKTDLVRTLAQYLDCGGNYDQTAQALVIHRSTLRYRLRRIRDLAGLDLNDVDSRLNVHLATRAWKIIAG